MTESLKRQRSACKGSLTKIVKFSKDLTDGSPVSAEEIKTRLVYAKELLELFLKLEAVILETPGEEPQIGDFEDEYLGVIAKLNAALRIRHVLPYQETGSGDHDETMNCSLNQPINIVKYAKVDIPIFSGDPTEFQSFIDLFNAAVHNIETYTKSQKFQLLKRYLAGEAAALVRHMPITDANYTAAMTRIKQRYDRKKPIIYAFIRKFIGISKISRATASSLRSAHHTADEVLRGLNALGDTAEVRDWWLIYLLLERMDDDTKSLWAQKTVSTDQLEIGDLLTSWMLEALDAIRVPDKSTVPMAIKKHAHSSFKSTTYTASAVPVEPKSSSCPLCMKAAHRLIDCAKYNTLAVHARQEHLLLQNRCFNCLNSGHRVKFCSSKSRYAICHRRHHRSLYTDEHNINTDSEPAIVTSTLTQPKVSTLLAAPNTIAVLPTAMVLIVDNHGIEREYRALLDSGSQASFVTESCVQQLGLRRFNSRINITGIGHTSAGTSRGAVTIHIKPKGENRTDEITINVLILPKIAATLAELMTRDDLKWLSTVQLADPKCYQSRSIDILLGADIFFNVLEEGRLRSPNTNLIAQNTKFGWVVGGNAGIQAQNVQTHCTLFDIDNAVRRFWEVEEVQSSNQRTLSTEEEACVKHYKENTVRTTNGRFITRLPFKSDPTKIQSNYHTAFSQHNALYRRFKRDPELHRLYTEFLTEYNQLGHMIKVDGPINSNAYFIPHHGVLKEQNSTTKLRVVFNASSRIGENPSLNNMLPVGPNVQSTLWAILLRFRLSKYVFAADIEKMYRQISVHELDQPYQLILWRDDENNMCTFQLTTVTYGTSSAPFVATNTLNELAAVSSHVYPKAAKVIKEDVYVDDVLTGANTIEELSTLKREICAILQDGKFNLRKFVSNHPKLHDPAQPNNLKLLDDNKDTVKVLGIQWDPIQDGFRFATYFPLRTMHTKRSILSEASRLFDSFGWLSPLLIRSKIILQHLWRSHVDWDDNLPDEILNGWLRLRHEMKNANSIQLDRWVSSSLSGAEELELHGLSDASEVAYSAVVFLRVTSGNQSTCRILSSKTKVGPLKAVSLSRLELLGAELLANHCKSIIIDSKLPLARVTLWTDSNIVLDWLSSSPRRWATFVANRVGKIITLFNKSHWRHIPSQLNPADCASRGISLEELKNHPLWWSAPAFLRQSENY